MLPVDKQHYKKACYKTKKLIAKKNKLAETERVMEAAEIISLSSKANVLKILSPKENNILKYNAKAIQLILA